MPTPDADRKSKARPNLDPLARRLRKEMSIAERKLWSALRGRRFAAMKFRRQHAIGRFIADFACVEARLIVEVDGESHDYSVAEDEERTRILRPLGFAVIRVRNEDVLFNFEGVLKEIFEHLRLNARAPSP